MTGSSGADTRAAARRWVDDLVLGIRLAVGGSRNSWARLLLTAVGVGIGVAVLLLAASLPNLIDDHSARRTSREVPVSERQPVPHLDPVLAARAHTQYRGRAISGVLLQPLGPNHTMPNGLTEVPKPGTWAVSPSLAALLDSPEGELLRPRFAGPRTIIADEGLTGPMELFFYGGASDLKQSGEGIPVYRFGDPPSRSAYVSPLLLLVLVALATLLIPVVVFIATSTRLAAAARDRRLAAIRLVGANSAQARRVAAGETLVGALAGLVLGAVFFLVGRQFVELFEIEDVSVFAVDVRPTWWLALPVVLGVPALTVAVSMAALRNTLVDPLGSVRQRVPMRRRLAWRLVPLVLGLGALATQAGAFAPGGTPPSYFGKLVVVAGVILLMVSIPVLLPWLVEKLAGLLRGGRVSWQLAVRRLQLDSGNAARVIAGVAVVLAGGIALQTMLLTAGRDYPRQARTADPNALRVYVNSGIGDPQRLLGSLHTLPGLRSVSGYSFITVRGDDPRSSLGVFAGSCEELARLAAITDCAPGRSWLLPPQADADSVPLRPGDKVTVQSAGPDGRRDEWTIPKDTKLTGHLPGELDRTRAGLLVTPGVLPDDILRRMSFQAVLRLDPGQPEAAERVRNALGPLGWRSLVTLADYSSADSHDPQAANYATIKRFVFGGMLVALLMAAASLLVIGFEQVRERRRPLAVLAASGVPRRTLAVSLLWQHVLPTTLAVLVAAVTGVAMSALLLRALGGDVTLDWGAVGLSSAAAFVAALAVALLTLPSVLRAMRPEGLRAE